MDKKKEYDQKYRKFFHELDRSLFVPEEYRLYARLDQPLTIGFGQTISQPSLVLRMTELLDPSDTSRVLEIGTGSGYQTAFLAQFSEHVYTVERFRELSIRAQKVLADLGYDNVSYLVGDGSMGWSEHAPYDRIMVTAGAGKMPEELLDQLKPTGRMLLPLGNSGMQELTLVRKDLEGKIQKESCGLVRFVEFHGWYGWNG